MVTKASTAADARLNTLLRKIIVNFFELPFFKRSENDNRKVKFVALYH